MENEKDISNFIDIDEEISNETLIFIPEYEGQNVSFNNDFLKWKKSMLNIYGENAALFKCLKDNILYYTSYDECKSYPVYQSKCPKCKNKICFYCSRYIEDLYDEKGTCCLRRKIKCMFYQDCYRYINPIIQEENINTFLESIISFIIPGVGLSIYIEHIQGILFFKLATKKSLQYKKIERYYQHLKNYDCIELINIFFTFILVIPLFIIHIYFIISIILISIPFKFIPLKYFLGIHFATLKIW